MTKKRKTMDQEVHVDLTLETSPFAVKTVEKNDYLELEKSLALRLAKFPPGCRTLKLFLKNNFVHVSMHVVQDVLIYLPTREIAYRVSNDGLFHHSSATTLAVESDLNFSHGTPVRWKRKKGNEFEAGIILTAPFKSQATGEFHVYHIMDLQNRVHRIPLPFVHYRVEQEISPPPQPPTSVSLPLVHKDRKCGTAIKPLVIARPPTLDESQKPPSIAIQEGKCADGTEVDQNERKLSPVKSLDVPPIQDDEIIGKMPQKKVKSDLSSEFVSPPSLTSEREVLAKEDTTHPQSNPMHDDEIVKLPRKELTRVLSSEAPMPLSITNERNICAQEHITHSYSRTSPVNSLEVPQIQANSGVQPPRNKMKFTLFSKGPRPANLSSESNVFAQEDITDPNCSTSPVDAPQMQPNDIVQLSRKKVKSALSSKASRYPNLTCGRNVLEQKDTPRSKSVVRTIYIPYCVQVDIFQVKGQVLQDTVLQNYSSTIELNQGLDSLDGSPPSLQITGPRSDVDKCTRIIESVVAKSVVYPDDMGRMMYTLALLNRTYSRVHNDLVYGYSTPQFLHKEWMGVVNLLQGQAGVFSIVDDVRLTSRCSVRLMTKTNSPYLLVSGAEGPRVAKTIEELKARLA